MNELPGMFISCTMLSYHTSVQKDYTLVLGVLGGGRRRNT